MHRRHPWQTRSSRAASDGFTTSSNRRCVIVTANCILKGIVVVFDVVCKSPRLGKRGHGIRRTYGLHAFTLIVQDTPGNYTEKVDAMIQAGKHRLIVNVNDLRQYREAQDDSGCATITCITSLHLMACREGGFSVDGLIHNPALNVQALQARHMAQRHLQPHSSRQMALSDLVKQKDPEFGKRFSDSFFVGFEGRFEQVHVFCQRLSCLSPQPGREPRHTTWTVCRVPWHAHMRRGHRIQMFVMRLTCDVSWMMSVQAPMCAPRWSKAFTTAPRASAYVATPIVSLKTLPYTIDHGADLPRLHIDRRPANQQHLPAKGVSNLCACCRVSNCA